MELLTKTEIPEQARGRWRIERFSVSDAEAARFNLYMMVRGIGHRTVKPGDYTRLMEDGRPEPVMSDTPAELLDHEPFVARATGRVLVAGLGLGIVVEALLRKPDVTHVTVVELDADVIGMTGDYLIGRYGLSRLTIVHDDVYGWVPPRGARFDRAWFDVWPDICADNLKDFTRLRRRYRNWCASMAFWAEIECLRERR